MRSRKIGGLILAMTVAVSCAKKDDEETTTTSRDPDQPAGVLALQSTIMSKVGELHLTEYGDTSLRLAETSWTETEWGTTPYFNCFGECQNGSQTPASYLDQATDPDKSGPVGNVKESISMLCVVGAVFGTDNLDADGLPKDMTDAALTLSADAKTKLIDECGETEESVGEIEQYTLKGTVKSLSADAAYDKIVTLNITTGEGEMSFTFYLKNSDGKVAIASISTDESKMDGVVNSVTRSLFAYDIADGILRFEYFDRTFPKDGTPIANAGSFSFYRGFHDSNTKEVRFLSNMGSSNYALNNTFLSLSGNEDQAQAGGYFARTGEGTNLEGAFVCFNKVDGSFVNATGCDETSNDRKQAWGPTAAMWIAVEAKDFADWGLGEATSLPDFDADTMYTVEPNYK